MLICLTGVDGSGKTTQGKLLVERLSAMGMRTSYIWSRGHPIWRGSLLRLGKWVLRAPSGAAGLSQESDLYRSYQTRKAKLFRCRLVRALWEISVSLEHVLEIRLAAGRLLRSGHVVVSDRYIWDSMIDLAVAFGESDEGLRRFSARRWWKLVPKAALTILLDVSDQVALSRKDDIPAPEYVLRRISLYRALATDDGVRKIDGSRPAAVVHEDVMGLAIAALVGEGH